RVGRKPSPVAIASHRLAINTSGSALRSKNRGNSRMSSLGGKVAIVTGASQGIGRAIAERLAPEGATVAVNFISDRRKAEGGGQSMKCAGGRGIAVEGDVRDSQAVRQAFDNLEKELGQPDIVVANAGVNMNKPVVDTTDEDFERIFSVNARGTFFVLREA